MKYPGYFLIVADFIKWAKSQGIPVGPGRGSGAGSLVAYSLTITDLDPIRFGLLFERFLNPERVSMPDFDIDFCQDRRDEVIKYVQGKYGHDRVAQIITFGTLQARGVLRDVGRVLQMPYGQVDKLTKLVPQNPANPVTLKRAIDDEPRLQAERDRDPVVRRAFDIAQKLEGLHRHASTHAAGIVIGERPLNELVPLYRDPKSNMPVTQFNMKWVEPAGLVKFDFLGLKTLTVLETAVALRRTARYRGRSVADSARRQEDLRDAGARRDGGRVPGGKSGHAARTRRHAARSLRGHHRSGRALPAGPDGEYPDLLRAQARAWSTPTICIQNSSRSSRRPWRHRLSGAGEQIARDLAGYTLGKADLLRRAMGKKIRNEMASQRARLRRRRGRTRNRQVRRDCHLRRLREVRRIRLQQIAFGAIRAAHLPDRLYESELSRGIPGGVDDARHGQYR